MNSNQDAEHLRLLSIFHFVLAGMFGLFSLFPVIHLVLGFAMLGGAFDSPQGGQAPPEFIGWIFVIVALLLITTGLTMATCMAFAGRYLTRRTGYTFCLVVAGMECLFMPFGTVLGVFTLIVLMRPSVKTLFGVGETF